MSTRNQQPTRAAPDTRFVAAGSLAPPGPLGRLLRIALGVVLAWFTAQWLGVFGATGASWTAWLSVAVSLWVAPTVINVGWGTGLGNTAPRLVLLSAGALVALLSGWMGQPAVAAIWTGVATTQVYVFGHLALSFIAAGILATPGCEMRALAHARALVRGVPAAEHPCPSFIARVDRWELARRGRAPVFVQFLSFPGCPRAPDLQAALGAALSTLEADQRARVRVESIDVHQPDTPDVYRRWGSPTLLVNGQDLVDSDPGEGLGCRIYPGPGSVPSAESIRTRILEAMTP